MEAVEFARIPPWERMRSLVAEHLDEHPLLRGVAVDRTLEASRFGVRMRCGPEPVAVMRFEWFLPLSEERARRLAGELALQARGTLDNAAA
ncbi:MAG TPA: hypothetical protein VF613_02035 [Longimicrobium sp.]